jgi:hypothetical protein
MRLCFSIRTPVGGQDAARKGDTTNAAEAFLWEADMLIADVKLLFLSGGDFAWAARLKDIQGRLADEIQAVERLIAAGKPGLRN